MPLIYITNFGTISLPELLLYIVIAVVGKDGVILTVRKVYEKVKKHTNIILEKFTTLVKKYIDNPKIIAFLEEEIEKLEDKINKITEEQ